METCRKHYYEHPDDNSNYIICSDKDGYSVEKPDGSFDSYGTGYSLDDIENVYGLEDPYKEKMCQGLCNDNKEKE